MRKNKKLINDFKLFQVLLMSIVVAFTPLVANLNGNKINTAFADTINELNVEVAKDVESEIKDKADKLDQKVQYEGVIEDNFSDDTVIIVLNESETHKFKIYTPNDFPEIDCVSVNDLTQFSVGYVKEEIGNRKAGIKKEKTNKVNTDNFRRILSLELAEKSKENVIEAIKKLEKRSDILSAEPNSAYTFYSTPNDTYYSSHQWGLNKIQAEDAWDITTGSNTVTVGVMDSGIEGSHPDLVNRMSNAGLHREFASGTVVTVTTPTDSFDHGTHVAGIIGAQGNNGLGVAGVAWDVRLVSLKVGDSNGIDIQDVM